MSDSTLNGLKIFVDILSFFHVHLLFNFVLVYVFSNYNLDV